MLDALNDPGAVLDMRRVIFDSRVEDVRQAVLAHEDVWEDPDAFENGVGLVLIAPDLFEIVYGVYFFFVLLYVGKKVADCQLAFLEDRLDDC